MFECVLRAEAGAAAVLVSERFGGSFVFWAGAGGPRRFRKWRIRSLKSTVCCVYLKAEGGQRPLRHCRVLERV